MNQKLNKAFDKELKKELNRGRRVWIGVGLAILLVLAAYTPVFTETVHGETVDLTARDRGGVSNLQLKVKLKSGKEVNVFASDDVRHSTGRKVAISKATSVFGMATYQFVKYTN